MPQTQELTITLPSDLAELVRQKVAAGEYADESEVVRDGLESLLSPDTEFETWLHREVAPAYGALQANPEGAVPLSHVREALAAEHAKATRHG